MKAEPNQLIPPKPIENLELLIAHDSRVSYFFRVVRMECN